MIMKKNHGEIKIIFACFVQMFLCSAIIFSLPGLFVIPVSESLGIGQGQFTMYITVQCVTMAIGTPFSSKLLQKYDFAKLNFISIVLCGFGFGLMGFADSLASIYLCGAMIGLGCIFAAYLFLGTILPRWFKDNLGIALAISNLGMTVGGIILNPVCAKIIKSSGLLGFHEGWRSAFVIFGILIVCIGIPNAAAFLKNSPDMASDKDASDRLANAAEEADPGPAVPKEKAIRSISFYILLFMIVTWSLAAQISVYLPAVVTEFSTKFGISANYAGAAGSVLMAGGVIGSFLIGSANDRFGGQGGALTAGISGVAACMILLINHGNIAFMLAGVFIFGIYYAIAEIQLPAMIKTMYGTRDYEQIFTKAAIVSPWFGAISSSMWGFVYDLTGNYSTMLACGAVLCAGTMIFGVVAVLTSRKIR